jgi:hypothetical protein
MIVLDSIDILMIKIQTLVIIWIMSAIQTNTPTLK